MDREKTLEIKKATLNLRKQQLEHREMANQSRNLRLERKRRTKALIILGACVEKHFKDFSAILEHATAEDREFVLKHLKSPPEPSFNPFARPPSDI